MNKTITNPFIFVGCIEFKEMLGKKAWNEGELMEILEEIPLDSIYYHTHSYFLRNVYITRPYPNDFAAWVVTEVRDQLLGERLGILDPYEFRSLEDL